MCGPPRWPWGPARRGALMILPAANNNSLPAVLLSSFGAGGPRAFVTLSRSSVEPETCFLRIVALGRVAPLSVSFDFSRAWLAIMIASAQRPPSRTNGAALPDQVCIVCSKFAPFPPGSSLPSNLMVSCVR